MNTTSEKIYEDETLFQQLQPFKSSKIYQKEYSKFKLWLKTCGQDANEDTLLRYSVELARKYSPSSVRSKVSMIKRELMIEKKKIETSDRLDLYIKRINTAYLSTKAAVFSQEQLTSFLNGVPNNEFLMIKFILIIGFFACARTDDLCRMKWSDIIHVDQGMKFVIEGEKK